MRNRVTVMQASLLGPAHEIDSLEVAIGGPAPHQWSRAFLILGHFPAAMSPDHDRLQPSGRVERASRALSRNPFDRRREESEWIAGSRDRAKDGLECGFKRIIHIFHRRLGA